MRVIQANQNRDPSATVSSWSTPIEPPIEVLDGTEISLLSCAIQKGGADLLQDPNTIVLDSTFKATLRPAIQFVNGNLTNRFNGLGVAAGPAAEGDWKVYTLCDNSDGHLILPVVQISIPKGIYTPGALAAEITRQTREPATLSSKLGVLDAPTLVGNGAFSVSGTIDIAQLTVTFTTPYSAAHWQHGDPVTMYYFDIELNPKTFDTTVDVGVDPAGIVTLAAFPSDIFDFETVTTLVSKSGLIVQELRVVPDDPSQGAIGPDPSSATAQDAQFHFGCTTGISFTYNTSTDKFQVQMHSPLLDSSGNVVYQASDAGSISPEGYGTGCGKRGRLAFYNGWTGIAQADWQDSLFYKMGFNWEDLNPEAGITDNPSGWLTSDALLDSTMDSQSNVAALLPYTVLTQQVTGPTSQLLADRYSARGTPGWLVECSLLPSTGATSWTGADGRNLSSIIGQATRQFSSLDYYHSSVGPIWRVSLPEKAPPIIAGSMRIRLLKSDTAEEDSGIGQDSAVTILVTP